MARSRDFGARWCALAEQRLDYLTELLETGRWRRYYSEPAIFENIEEARAAVETWRDLSAREASRTHSATGMSWLGRTPAAPPRSDRLQTHLPQPTPAEITAEPPRQVPVAVEAGSIRANDAFAAPEPGSPAPVAALSNFLRPAPEIIATQERYPLLRNAM